jgi:hypothetical protein
MNDHQLRAAYPALIRRPATGRNGCATPEALDALALRRGSEAERLATLNHAMTCTDCRRELDLLRAVERAAPEPAWRPRVFALAATLMLAAGAALVWRATRPADGGPLRGEAARVMLLDPADGSRVMMPLRLVWRAVPDAVGYRVEVLDWAGAVVATAVGPDTAAQLPTDALAPSDSAYRWRVVAELRTGGTLSSGVRRVTVRAP